MTKFDNDLIEKEIHISLKDYVDLRFAILDKQILTAKELMEARLHTMNGIHAILEDTVKRTVPRTEFDIQVYRMCEDIKKLQTSSDEAKGKASQSGLIFAYAVGVIGLILSVISLFQQYAK